MSPRPKKPPDPSQPHLLGFSLISPSSLISEIFALMEPQVPIFMPSRLPRAFGQSSVAQAKFSFRNPFFTPSDVQRPISVVHMVLFARISVRSKFLVPKFGSAAADGKWVNRGVPFKRQSGFACQFRFRPRSLPSPDLSRSHPSIVVMALGFHIQGPLQEEESLSPSIRFDFLFNLGVCQFRSGGVLISL
uniref:Uncharacterized protein n=1 Tax=Opuntia streptacantha TaxID=393608 RepID=A0A7C9EDQ0_OPUST